MQRLGMGWPADPKPANIIIDTLDRASDGRRVRAFFSPPAAARAKRESFAGGGDEPGSFGLRFCALARGLLIIRTHFDKDLFINFFVLWPLTKKFSYSYRGCAQLVGRPISRVTVRTISGSTNNCCPFCDTDSKFALLSFAFGCWSPPRTRLTFLGKVQVRVRVWPRSIGHRSYPPTQSEKYCRLVTNTQFPRHLPSNPGELVNECPIALPSASSERSC